MLGGGTGLVMRKKFLLEGMIKMIESLDCLLGGVRRVTVTQNLLLASNRGVLMKTLMRIEGKRFDVVLYLNFEN